MEGSKSVVGLHFKHVYFSGQGVYDIELPKQANVLDVFLTGMDMVVAYTAKDPFLHLTERKFHALPQWGGSQEGLDMSKMVYLGVAPWPVSPNPSQQVTIEVQDGNNTPMMAMLPTFKEGEQSQMSFEHYLIFEELQSEG